MKLLSDPQRYLVVACLLPLLCAGCGRSDGTQATVPVTGTVTYGGFPVTSGTVMFTPLGGGPTATGELDTNGTYRLETYNEGDGAVGGEHKVTITALNLGSGLPEDPLSEPLFLVPQKYSSDRTSGLTASVDSGLDENVVDFQLEDED